MSTPSFKHIIAASGLFAVFLLILGGMVMIALQSPTGDIITESETLSTFSRIDNNIYSDIIWTPSDDFEITVTGDEVALNDLSTDVSDGELTIDYSHSNWRTLRDKVSIEISSPSLDSIELTNKSTLTTSTITTDSFALKVEGGSSAHIDYLEATDATISVLDTSEVTIAGQTDVVDVEVSGNGQFTGDSLISTVANIQTEGESNASVYASATRNFQASQSSSIIVGSLGEVVSR